MSAAVITRDNFVKVMKIDPKVAKRLGRRAQDQLFALIVEEIERAQTTTNYDSGGVGTGGLAYLIPGTRLHIRLNETIFDNLARISAAYIFLTSGTGGPIANITTAALASLYGRIKVLEERHGETCIAEVISEFKEATQEQICVHLFGKPCRYPDAKCQFFLADGTCGISVDGATRVVDHLKEKKILESAGPLEPVRWKITV